MHVHMNPTARYWALSLYPHIIAWYLFVTCGVFVCVYLKQDAGCWEHSLWRLTAEAAANRAEARRRKQKWEHHVNWWDCFVNRLITNNLHEHLYVLYEHPLTARYCGPRLFSPVRFPHMEAALSCCICCCSCWAKRFCSLSFWVSANFTTIGDEHP